MAPHRSRSAHFWADLAHLPLSERSQWPLTVPGLRSFCRPGTPAPVRALSVAPHRSRSAEFLQTWHTYPCQSAFHGPSPFQVCAVLTDLAHPPLSEHSQWPLTVPGLHGFDRPGTPTPVRALSVASHRSRSAQFLQTWHTRPCQSALCGSSPFQVCGVFADLAHLPLPKRFPWPFSVPGLRSFDRPGTPAPVRALSVASHRSRSARF